MICGPPSQHWRGSIVDSRTPSGRFLIWSRLAEGFVRGCFYRLQWSWVDALKMNSWTHDEIAQLFLWLPFCPECWSRVESSLGEHKDLYWRRVLVNPYQCGDQLDAAADVLLAHGRPRAALECVAHGLRDKKTVDLKRAIDVLLAGVSSSEPIHSLHAHHLVTVIQALQENPATPSEALLQVEWAYLPLLNEHHGATPKLLETTIASDPQFFCELVRKVYRSKKAQADVDKLWQSTRTTYCTTGEQFLEQVYLRLPSPVHSRTG